MIRQIKLLTKLQICNSFGINEVRFTKEKKKKVRFYGLAAVWVVLIACFLSYVAGMAVMLAKLNMAQFIPSALFAITSVMVFIVTFFKTGNTIFQQKAFEQQIALPVSKTAIIVSRFLSMYVTNLVLTSMVMIAGSVVYGVLMHPAVSFYVYGVFSIVLLPLLPITLATIIGAVITAISARMKHKSLVETVLTLALAILIIGGSMVFSGSGQTEIEGMVQNLAETMEQQIGSMYPPALWVGNAMVSGNFWDFILFALVSLVTFGVFLVVLQKYFLGICTALATSSGKKSYHLTELSTSSIRKALWKKELKRYFASTVYVTNTMIGYAMMVLLSAVILVAGIENINVVAGAESMGQALDLEGMIRKLFPFVLSFMPAMMPMTAASISMEGKQWWIMQSLPVRKKDIILGKVLANITVVAPFYLVAEVLTFLAFRPDLQEGVWLVLIPAVYILFSVVVGIVINLHFPVFDWENETRVIKQSTSTFLTMLTAAVIGIIPAGILLAVPDGFVSVYMATVVCIVLVATVVLWRKQCVKEKVLQ